MLLLLRVHSGVFPQHTGAYGDVSSSPKPPLSACKGTVNSSSFLGGVCEQFLILVNLFASVYIPRAICEQKRLAKHLSAHPKQTFSFTLLGFSLQEVLATVQVLLIWNGKTRVVLHLQSITLKKVAFCSVALHLLYAQSNLLTCLRKTRSDCSLHVLDLQHPQWLERTSLFLPFTEINKNCP